MLLTGHKARAVFERHNIVSSGIYGKRPSGWFSFLREFIGGH
jgi:hypothetical protein